jgi:hypothetical protein
MRKLLLATLLVSALCATAQVGEVVIKPVKYTCTFSTPDGDKLYPHGGHGLWGSETGCEIQYLVTGHENVAEVDSQSLNIISLTDKDGKPLNKDYKGRGRWASGADASIQTLGSTYINGKKVEENRILLKIFIPTEEAMVIPYVRGVIDVQLGGNPETQTLTFKTDEKIEGKEVGPFTLVVNGDEDKTGLSIKLKGDPTLIKETTFKDADGKDVRWNGGSSSRGGDDSYWQRTFGTTKTPEITFTVTYYTEMQLMPITIHAKPGDAAPTPLPAPVPELEI